MFMKYNPNPHGNRVGDCTVRAISCVLGQDWDSTFLGLIIEGFITKDMPSANNVWGAYLRYKGFERCIIPNDCPDCYTVADFCKDYPEGTYLLALQSHVVAVKDGNWYDTWDSGNEVPIYYWHRKDD